MSGPTYALVAGPAPVRPPVLDEDQRRVVEHPGGPLLVLAGPGTGKTTTLVEAIADRVERRGAAPESVLALTFSRKAAEQLRDRVTGRLGRTTGAAACATFHSFAYGLIRRYAPAELYVAPLRLLSAPEQDVVLRELLAEHPESVRWPETFQRALGTRGFAREVQAVLSRAREKGLDGEALQALGEESGAPELVAAGLFLEQYLVNLDSQGATDYADLIRRATIEAEVHRDELRARYAHVFVDEYQDTDPGQVELLAALAGDGRDLVVVGDPHQSIYAFRGAEVRGILEFPTRFPRADGTPADVVALRTTRRFGPRLLTAAQRVAGRLTLAGTIPAQARAAFAAPRAADGLPPGRVQALTFDTERAEAEHLADLLRRAHLEDGIAWHDMAVLVRSGRATLPALRRSLVAAGVPVEVAADDTPLVRDAAVLPLLDALRAVLHLDDEDPADPEYVDPARAVSLLTGPLGGLDAGGVRRLARRLRAREAADARTDGLRTTSRELVRRAVCVEGFLDDLPSGRTGEVDRARALATLLRRARAAVQAGASAEEVLWELWAGTDWPRRLQRRAEAGGVAARRADRDLDALCALFEAAARHEEQRDHAGIGTFVATLVAQQIPADTLAERGVRGSAVRLLTAHRSKGLEWRLVVVAHVQQETWPDLRRRASLLQPDRIGRDGLVPPVSARALLMEERRLFYVACTRARERLVVTAVRSAEDEGEQPSPFLAELGVDRVHVAGRPARPLSLPGMVAALRRTVTDPAATPALRDAAARRLARLARARVGTRPVAPAADPASWWGVRATSYAEVPVRPADQPVPVSASVLESVLTCPLQWYLTREAGGAGAEHQSQNLGQLVHALAERVAREPDGTETVEGEVAALMRHVEAVWERLVFRTPWSSAREHERIRVALDRFVRWHRANRRALVGTELSFRADVPLDDGGTVRLHGRADRLEVDADGRAVVVDLKTGRGKPSGPAVAGNRQLAVYQYAVDLGGFVETAPPAPQTSGGAELLQLGLEDGSEDATVQAQPPPDPEGPERAGLRAELAQVAAHLREESFPARTGPQCRDCAFLAVCPVQSPGSVVLE